MLAGAVDGGVEALGHSDGEQGENNVDDLDGSEGVEGERQLHEADDGEQAGKDYAEDSGEDGLFGHGDDRQDEDYGGDQKADSDVRLKELLVIAPEQGSEDDGRESADPYQHDEYFCQLNAPCEI